MAAVSLSALLVVAFIVRRVIATKLLFCRIVIIIVIVTSFRGSGHRKLAEFAAQVKIILKVFAVLNLRLDAFVAFFLFFFSNLLFRLLSNG